MDTLLDTTVIIHLFRKNPEALVWIASRQGTLSITSITWMETVAGAANKRAQRDTLKLLDEFGIIYLNQVDQDWAMRQMERYQLRYSMGMNDCLIASVAHRLQIPLYTHNLKDMIPLLGDQLAIRPYN